MFKNEEMVHYNDIRLKDIQYRLFWSKNKDVLDTMQGCF